jgi:hypothetical protein
VDLLLRGGGLRREREGQKYQPHHASLLRA